MPLPALGTQSAQSSLNGWQWGPFHRHRVTLPELIELMYAYNNPINSYSLQFVAPVGAYVKVIGRFSFQPERLRNLDASVSCHLA